MPTSNLHRKGHAGFAIIAATCLLAAPLAHATETKTYELDIAASRTDTALMALAETTGTQIVFEPRAVRTRTSSRVEGRHTLSEALDAVLAGTHLEYAFTASDFVVVRATDEGREYGPLAVTGRQLAQAKREREERTTELEEIIVTAERREQSIQSMSLSIAALDGAELVAEGKNSLDDALLTVAGVRVQNLGFTGGTPFIRGVGPSVLADPSAAVSLDGVYQSQGLFGSQFDVARVEVLRGPQGTLYGRNATAGSVNIITNDASSEFGGSGSVQAGSYNAMRIEGALNVPLTNRLAVRAAYMTSKRDGYYSNGTMDEDIQAGRIRLKYDLDNVTMRLTADSVRLDGKGPGATQAPLSAHSSNPWYTTQLTGRQQSTRKSVYGQLDWDMAIGVLTYQPAWYKVQIYIDTNLVPGRNLIVSNQLNRQQTHELRLASQADRPLKWLLGAYYLDNKGVANPLALRLAAANHETPTPTSVTPTETESRAVFGQLTAPVSDKFRLIAGGRYTWDKKTAARTFFASTTPGAGVLSVTTPVSIKTNKFTYKAGLEYDLAADKLLYATYSTGFKAGGINNPTANFSDPNAYATYQPEEIKAIELGSKNRFLDNRLQLSLSVFHYDFTNYQVFTTSFVVIPPIASVLNAATATLWGGEIESSFKITPSDRLDVSVAYNNNKFDKFRYFSDLNPPPTGLDRSGTHLPQAPVWSESLGYSHDFTLGNSGVLALGGEARFSSGYDASIQPSVDSHQPAYSIVDLRASYRPEQADWSLNFYVNNVTNEAVRLFSRVVPLANLNELVLDAPRTYGVGLTARF